MVRKQKIIILVVGLLCCASALAQMGWHNPLSGEVPYVQGRAWNQEIGQSYHRIPERVREQIPVNVWNISRQSAGLYVKFFTNAEHIEIKYRISGEFAMTHMPATGVSGVDLYAMNADGKQYWCSGRHEFGDTVCYHYEHLSYANNHGRGNEYTLYLPLYNEVRELWIGTPSGAEFSFVQPSTEKPVIVYGTSIVQGACASRPGMAWTNILQRRMDMPVLNFGFSGSGQLETEFFELLAEIDARVFVIDCMPNMGGERVAWIQERIEKGIRVLRAKRKEAPILLIEHDGYMGYHCSEKKKQDFERCNEELRMVYQKMKDEIPGLYYLTFEELALSMDSQVDGVHATDVGMLQYADACCRKLSEILYPAGCMETVYTPCRQHRDAYTYNWMERHEKILAYNREYHPEVAVLGNSIVHYWGGCPEEHIRRGNDAWNRAFQGVPVVNLGFGYDRIENLKWRILHSELDGGSLKKLFVMIGTNNLQSDPDEDIVKGIGEVVDLIRWKCPEAKIYVVCILPRRDIGERLFSLNNQIKTSLRQREKVTVLDWSPLLLRKDGKIKEELFSDGLHPNDKGYRIIACELKKILCE